MGKVDVTWKKIKNGIDDAINSIDNTTKVKDPTDPDPIQIITGLLGFVEKGLHDAALNVWSHLKILVSKKINDNDVLFTLKYPDALPLQVPPDPNEIAQSVMNAVINGIHEAEGILNQKNLMIAGGNVTVKFHLVFPGGVQTDSTISVNISPNPK